MSQMIVGSLPELAFLFDRMTTHVLSDRLSASSALAYFEQVVKGLPDQVLGKEARLEVSWDLENTDRYWSLLPPELASAWAEYRTPPIPFRTKVLSFISRYDFGYTVLCYVRRRLRI